MSKFLTLFLLIVSNIAVTNIQAKSKLSFQTIDSDNQPFFNEIEQNKIIKIPDFKKNTCYTASQCKEKLITLEKQAVPILKNGSAKGVH